jgi:hypothetical protein
MMYGMQELIREMNSSRYGRYVGLGATYDVEISEISCLSDYRCSLI